MKFSGVGRARVREVILVASGLKEISEVRNNDIREWIEKNILPEAE
jgi:hypothetical protein